METTHAQRVCLELAGLRFALVSADTELPLYVAGAMSRFVVAADTEADIHINTAWGEPDEHNSERQLFDSGSVWRLYACADGGYEFRCAAPFSAWRTYKRARFSADWTRGEILCARRFFDTGAPVYPLEYPLDEVLLSNLLAAGRGVELHACAVVDADGSGYLFVGQSGAGKSTTARLWADEAGVRILSDERVVLRAAGGRIWMYGTPWHGEAQTFEPARAPLMKIFCLGRGVRNEVVALHPAEAAARLFAASFPPFHSPAGIDFTLAFLAETCSQVEVSELRFVPDERAVEFVRKQAAVSTACGSGRVYVANRDRTA